MTPSTPSGPGITLSTHVLDTALGAPARGVRVVLERLGGDGAIEEVAFGATDADGRVQELAAAARGLRAGTYRLRFDTGAYFAAGGRETLYPEVAVAVSLAGEGAHYHVPLLVSPFGYTTYRGS